MAIYNVLRYALGLAKRSVEHYPSKDVKDRESDAHRRGLSLVVDEA